MSLLYYPKNREVFFSLLGGLFSQYNEGVAWFLPHTDREWRIQQFVDYCKKGQKKSVQLLDVMQIQADTENEFFEQFPEISQNLIIHHAELLLQVDKQWMLRLFHSLHIQQNTSIVYFLECTDETKSLFCNQPNFIVPPSKVFPYPLYTRSEVFDFIKYLQKKFAITIPQKEREKVYSFCGGYIWLIKEYCRNKIDHNLTFSDLIKEPTFVWKTKQIWDSYSLAMKNAVNSQSEHSILAEFNILLSNSCRLPEFLYQYIQKEQKSSIHVQDGFVFYYDKRIPTFTPSEADVLHILLTHKKCVLRETLAISYWGQKATEGYSEWALSQVIYRIKKKIKNTQLPITIRSKKGVGYELIFSY